MQYEKIVEGVFVNRPNRFIAVVEINGTEEICHVKNTGRCRELLVPGVRVYLEEHDNPMRKTRFSLVGVKKESRLINMDSQAPNKVVKEWIEQGELFKDLRLLRPEMKYGSSRFDFYVEYGEKKAFIEVKGVTLEEENVVRFPDAPTLRGVKHVMELQEAMKAGYEAYVIFVIQMEGVEYFTPNDLTHKEFGDSLRQAKKSGVNICAFDCKVTKNSLHIHKVVKVVL